MNAAAQHVLRTIPDICFAYGVSDEYSFVFDRTTTLFDRRRDKLVSTVVSTFTAGYIGLWQSVMSETRKLDVEWLPGFDGRAVCFPTTRNLRDYLCWRQVDCHVNNLYNTTFWALVLRGGVGQTEAEEELKGTVAGDKNEILFGRFGVNYNEEGVMFRKGSCVFREYEGVDGEGRRRSRVDNGPVGDGDEVEDEDQVRSKTQREKMRKAKQKAKIVVRHVDIIKDEFWEARPWILCDKTVKSGS